MPIGRWLHKLIDSETIEDRDRIMLGSLAPIGIERGKPFAPDARMQKILIDAEQVGKLMMVNEAFSPRTVPDGVAEGTLRRHASGRTSSCFRR